METKTIFFIGKPGCGKDDQSKFLSEKTGWRILSSGDGFRAIAAEDTPVGRKMKAEIDAGLLAPHWFAVYLFLKNLFSLAEDESIIFDGFSRKLPEAELAVEALSWLNRSFSVLYLKVSDEEIKKRISLRKEIQGRVDDTGSIVDERLKEYYANTEPVVEMFREKGMLIEIDGERAREPIAEDILKVLNLQ
ncbi:MAG: nucleoside monophosphate kinase [Candidatus Paceibacterota bacterium]|jgi:adenylate kinase